MKKTMLGAVLAGTLATTAFADLPTASQIQKNMGMGFNIGNTMEVPNNPTYWGNAYPTQALLDSIKAAGFNTVRIPCAWDSHAPGGVITETWLDSVKTVVDYAMRAGLYTILNIHHEGENGWFQTHIGTSVDNSVNTKLKNYWTQIANKFKNYDEHLIFAAANEPGRNLTSWTSDNAKTLMSYYQTFVNAVRGTGGNNGTRTLIIQGLDTDIDKSVKLAPTTLFPTDVVSGRLMFEVHYYDPYQYTLMLEEQDWGAPTGMIQCQYYYGDYQKASEPKRNAGYNAWSNSIDSKLAGIGHTNEQFAKMKSNYVDKGYPVIVGEFGANTRSPDLSGSDLNLSKQGRIQWHKDVVTAAKNYGLTPILWDMGNESDTGYDNMAYIRHNTTGSSTMGKVVDVDVINAMRSVYGLGNYVNNGIVHQDNLVPGDSPIGNSSSSSQQQPESSSSSEQLPEISSSSNIPSCDALVSDCVNTVYTAEQLCSMGFAAYCGTTPGGTDAIYSGKIPQLTGTTLIRQGNMLVAQNASGATQHSKTAKNASEIRLFDMNGNVIRYVRGTNNHAVMNLTNLPQGLYIAKSGNKTLKVHLK